jgi:hypothetical protein
MCHTSAAGRRFGELLGKLVKLSQHDVEEILEDQNATHRRFGEIALSWGLCEPEHVWQAWSEQLLTQVQSVDLEQLGVDAQAAAMIHREVALQLCAIPIRCLGNQLIVAVGEANTSRVAAELELITAKELRFVHADRAQIEQAIATYFPAGPAAA